MDCGDSIGLIEEPVGRLWAVGTTSLGGDDYRDNVEISTPLADFSVGGLFHQNGGNVVSTRAFLGDMDSGNGGFRVTLAPALDIRAIYVDTLGANVNSPVIPLLPNKAYSFIVTWNAATNTLSLFTSDGQSSFVTGANGMGISTDGTGILAQNGLGAVGAEIGTRVAGLVLSRAGIIGLDEATAWFIAVKNNRKLVPFPTIATDLLFDAQSNPPGAIWTPAIDTIGFGTLARTGVTQRTQRNPEFWFANPGPAEIFQASLLALWRGDEGVVNTPPVVSWTTTAESSQAITTTSTAGEEPVVGTVGNQLGVGYATPGVNDNGLSVPGGFRTVLRPLHDGTGVCFWAAFDLTDTGVSKTVYDETRGGVAIGFHCRLDPSENVLIQVGNGAVVIINETLAVPASAGLHFIIFRYATASPTDFEIFVDQGFTADASGGEAAAPNAADSAFNGRLLAFSRNTSNFAFDGQMGEIGVANIDPTPDQIVKLATYLSTRYGI